MGVYTSTYNFYMPSVGETGWGGAVGNNFQTAENELLTRVQLNPAAQQTGGVNVSGGGTFAAGLNTAGTLYVGGTSHLGGFVWHAAGAHFGGTVNMASGLHVGGTLGVASTAAFATTVTFTGGSVNFGADVNLYRLAADILRTADAFQVGGQFTAGTTALFKGGGVLIQNVPMGITANFDINNLVSGSGELYTALPLGSSDETGVGVFNYADSIAQSSGFYTDGTGAMQLYATGVFVRSPNLIVESASSGDPNIRVYAASSGSARLQEWCDNLGGTLAYVSRSGTILATQHYGSNQGQPQLVAAYNAGTYTYLTTNSNGNFTIAPSVGDLVLAPAGKDVVPNLSYDINLGSPTQKFLGMWVAEINAEMLVVVEKSAVAGGRLEIAPCTVLTADLSSSAGTIFVKHNDLKNGDIVYFEGVDTLGLPKFEAMLVNGTATTAGTAYTYPVLRNVDGTGANTWDAGQGILDTGQAGNGYIDLFSLHSSQTYHLDYIYQFVNSGATPFETGTYGANRNVDFSFDLFSGHAQHDSVYFGMAATKWDKLYINLQTAAVYTGGALTWEFWNGSAWTSFVPTFVGNTSGDLKATGVNGFEFVNTSLTNWATRTINGQSAYWIRVRWSTAPSVWTTAPVTNNRRIFRARGQYGPTIVFWRRNTSGTAGWNDIGEAAAAGNLSGLYGYGNETWGFAGGEYRGGTATNTNWFTIESTNGYRIYRGSAGGGSVLFQVDSGGTVAVGNSTTATTGAAPWITIDQTNGFRTFSVGGVTTSQITNAGTAIFGVVAAGQHNVWIGAGSALFRTNTTNRITIDTTDINMYDTSSNRRVNISSAGLITLGKVGSFPNLVLGDGAFYYTKDSGATTNFYADTNGFVRIGPVATNWTRFEFNAGQFDSFYYNGSVSTSKFTIDTSGNVRVGEVGSSLSNVYITSGALHVRNNTTNRISLTAAGVLSINDSGGNAVFTFDASLGAQFTLPLSIAATNGGVYQSTTGSFSSPGGNGWKLWNNAGVGTQEWYSGGTLIMKLDNNGLTFDAASSSRGLVLWKRSGTTVGDLSTYNVTPSNNVGLRALGDSSNTVATVILAAQGYVTGINSASVAFGLIGTDNTSSRTMSAYLYGDTTFSNWRGLYIGTSAGVPTSTYLLEVNGNILAAKSGIATVKAYNTSGADARLTCQDSTRGWSWSSGWAVAGDLNLIEESVAGSRMAVKMGGHVIINGSAAAGNTSGAEKLTVNDGRALFIANSSNYAVGVRHNNGGSTGQFYVGASNSGTPSLIISNNSGTNVLQIDHTGDLFVCEGVGANAAMFNLRYGAGVRWWRQDLNSHHMLYHDPNVAGGGQALLHYYNGGYSGQYLSAGGVWSQASSRAKKRDFVDLPKGWALDVFRTFDRIQKWRYKVEVEQAERDGVGADWYVGFMAEDFHAKVGVGKSDSITPVSEGGFLAATLQDALDVIDAMQDKLARLEARLAALGV